MKLSSTLYSMLNINAVTWQVAHMFMCYILGSALLVPVTITMMIGSCDFSDGNSSFLGFSEHVWEIAT